MHNFGHVPMHLDVSLKQTCAKTIFSKCICHIHVGVLIALNVSVTMFYNALYTVHCFAIFVDLAVSKLNDAIDDRDDSSAIKGTVIYFIICMKYVHVHVDVVGNEALFDADDPSQEKGTIIFHHDTCMDATMLI